MATITWCKILLYSDSVRLGSRKSKLGRTERERHLPSISPYSVINGWERKVSYSVKGLLENQHPWAEPGFLLNSESHVGETQ